MSLTELYCDQNQLTALNVANGNNTNFTGFYALNNPNLTCIEVDDAAWSTTNWTDIDATASFSEDCSSGVGIEELNSTSFSIYPNPAQTQLNIELKDISAPLNVRIVNLLGETVVTQKVTMGNNTIDVSELTSGVYFLKAGNNGAVKFIKE